MRMVFRLMVILAVLMGPAAGLALGQTGPGDRVSISAQWNKTGARPDDQRVLAIVLEMDEGWHVNPGPADARPVGDFNPIPTEVTVDDEATEAVQVGPVQWPEPHALSVAYAESEIPVYEDQTVLYLPVIVNAEAEPGAVTLPLTVRYQTCDDQRCLMPTEETLEPTLQISESGAAPADQAGGEALFADFDSGVFAEMQEAAAADWVRFNFFGALEEGVRVNAATWIGFGLTLAIAALGGLLLNFTPCVLPVIPLKVMGLAKSAGDRLRTLLLGLVMAAGVAGFWLGLGTMMATVSGFTATNQLFQYPAFTIGVGIIIALMAVGMCGLFSVRLPRWVYMINPRQDSYPGSFGFGVMTAVLSTPCTAPLMGAAAAWATTQTPAVTLATFLAIGTGMALPYVVLSAWPQLAKRMPRTGPGSELLKQVMGLLMLAAAAYFVGVGLSTWLQQPPDPPSLAYWWAVAGFIAAAGIWLAIRMWQLSPRPATRLAFVAVGLLAVLAAGIGANSLDDRGPIEWVHYTPDRFQQAKAEGNVVVMDFTADWCLNCKALEQAVLFDDRVVETVSGPGVVPMKVDITSRDNEMGWRMLEKAGRVTIPLLVVYGPDGEPVMKSDAYRVEQVLAAIEEAEAESPRQKASMRAGG